MALSLNPQHLRHYKDLALLLFKYGRRDLVKRAGLTELLPQEADRDERAAAAAEQLAADVERLGPTYIKLGQLLSTRPDVIPPAYAQALARLQDRCEPLPFAQIETVLAEELGLVASREHAELATPRGQARQHAELLRVFRDGDPDRSAQAVREHMQPGLDAALEEERNVHGPADRQRRAGSAGRATSGPIASA